ncbi:hypothetical protein BJ742DRAFT_838024 [Cladochytrium replicatum]|nr:hypothetical protein BJ742DRAFT_838024 [Cladochytrium replicatum]
MLPYEVVDRILDAVLNTHRNHSNNSHSLHHDLCSSPLSPPSIGLHAEPTHHLSDARRTLHTCLSLSRSWYFASSAKLWRQPDWTSIHSFDRFVRVVGGFSSEDPSRLSGGIVGRHGFSQWRVLDVTRTPLLHQAITAQHVSTMADASPGLSYIDLSKCAHLDDCVVSNLLMSTASSLASVNLSYCRQVTDLTVSILARFCEPWGKLECVILRSCGLVSDASLKVLADTVGPCIRKLDVSHCPRISDSGVATFIRRTMKRLKSIRYASHTKARPNHAEEDNEPVIQFQHYHDTTSSNNHSNDNEEVVGGRLVDLRFAGSSRFTRAGFLTVVNEAVKNNPNLETLEFSLPSPPKGSPFPLFQGFPTDCFTNLSRLHIHKAKYLDDSLVRALAEACGDSHVLASRRAPLVEFSLNEAIMVSPKSLIYCIARFKRLRFLSIRHCDAVNDYVLKNLAAMAPCFVGEGVGTDRKRATLEVLDVSECPGITSSGLNEMSRALQLYRKEEEEMMRQGFEEGRGVGRRKSMPHPLRRVDLCDCLGIDFAGVAGLVAAAAPPWGSLQWVDVTGCEASMSAEIQNTITEQMNRMGSERIEDGDFVRMMVPEYVGAESLPTTAAQHDFGGVVAQYRMRGSVVLTGNKMQVISEWKRVSGEVANAVEGMIGEVVGDSESDSSEWTGASGSPP